jgi:hypothetical protein
MVLNLQAENAIKIVHNIHSIPQTEGLKSIVSDYRNY